MVAVAEVFLGALLRFLLDRLLTPLNFLADGVGKKLKKWSEMLSSIELVLRDAEKKQLTSSAVELWLDDLKDLAYDIEDILDKFYTEMLRRKLDEQRGATTSKVRSLIPRFEVHFNMNFEIKEITNRLQAISERKDKLGLSLDGIGSSSTKPWPRPPSSCVLNGVPVVGRDSDKAKIVELLSRNYEPNAINFQVVAIVGMPGVGKTTLAQYVFNEDDVLKQFDLKAWVSVSDEFDVVRVTKAILESVTSGRCDLEEFSNIQNNLSKALAGKKFLIVLDDVWNTCDYNLWTTLQSPFCVGALGSKIIVTTRDAEVPRMMRSTEVHNLSGMSNGDCWKVFVQHAFFNIEESSRPTKYELLQEKIVAKCCGLPLAARTLGGLLGCKEINEWEGILNNKLWFLSDKSGILPVLKISYHYLPSTLKRCFAYCSILPNDYEFGETQLILLWMAEDLIQKTEENEQLEDVGREYFQELVSRSLFQKSSKQDSRYVMHHLISDLAQRVSGETCLRLEDILDGRWSPKTRHLSYTAGKYDGVKRFEAFAKAKVLRTFLPLSISEDPCNYLTCRVTFELLPKLQYLRVLSLNGYRLIKLPNSIGELKFLRYLDLSHTEITSLPRSISTLCNLQTLILENCYSLKALPANMKNLINLRHLNNSNTPSLQGMPAQLGQLTNLKTLRNFVVSKGSESSIREVEPLLHLQGTLRLSRLQNVNDIEDVKRADLISKAGLDVLLLEWNGLGEKESDVLDMLQPHRKLKVLSIKGYGGLEFSKWIGHPLLSSLTTVCLEGCNHCCLLPSLGQLPSLKKLSIKGLYAVEVVGLEFYGMARLPFPLLEILEFEDMKHWREWFPYEQDQDQGIRVFPCLKMLSISKCPKLEGRLPENLDSLSKLVIRGCEQLVISISDYKQLQKLDIDDCKRVVHIKVQLELLEALQLSSIAEFKLQIKDFMGGLPKLNDLVISGCDELTSLWQNEDKLLHDLISLHCLVIGDNPHLHLVQNLVSLQELHIYDCPSLISFQEFLLPPFVKEIKIERCSSLVYFARYRIPPNLRRMDIMLCENLKSLLEEEEIKGSSSSSSPYLVKEEESCLEYLSIEDCPLLTSLSFEDHLPRMLKHLRISDCEQLETITNRFKHNICLEEIKISRCTNLKCLPEGLCYLTNLQELGIYDCASLVSFPEGGLPQSAAYLREIDISYCNKLKALPKGIHDLNSLQILSISCCEGFTPFLEDGFPPNLIQLTIYNLKSCKALLDLGLHRLTSLRELEIRGKDPDVLFFPPEKEMVLPKSLIRLTIQDFPNLVKLSNGFQLLNCLQSFHIEGCPKLASMAEESLPLSLTQLTIYQCPLLEERCKPSKGRYWPSIAHIPYIRIQDHVHRANPDHSPRLPFSCSPSRSEDQASYHEHVYFFP